MILRSAVGLWSSVRGSSDRLSDAEYLSWGKRANVEALASAEKDLLASLREVDSLSDVLDAPYALQRVDDVRATMQLIVARVGEAHENLLHGGDFHAVFIAFAFGFSVGIVRSHRAKAAGLVVSNLPRKTLDQCERWGAIVALCYLVSVEARGIFDKQTDLNVYGIDEHWRIVASRHNFEPSGSLQGCVDLGRDAGERWSLDDSIDLAEPFTSALVKGNRLQEA